LAWALSFAHRFLAALAIFALPAADKTRFFTFVTSFPVEFPSALVAALTLLNCFHFGYVASHVHLLTMLAIQRMSPGVIEFNERHSESPERLSNSLRIRARVVCSRRGSIVYEALRLAVSALALFEEPVRRAEGIPCLASDQPVFRPADSQTAAVRAVVQDVRSWTTAAARTELSAAAAHSS
jgi:hypothetical protein